MSRRRVHHKIATARLPVARVSRVKSSSMSMEHQKVGTNDLTWRKLNSNCTLARAQFSLHNLLHHLTTVLSVESVERQLEAFKIDTPHTLFCVPYADRKVFSPLASATVPVLVSCCTHPHPVSHPPRPILTNHKTVRYLRSPIS